MSKGRPMPPKSCGRTYAGEVIKHRGETNKRRSRKLLKRMRRAAKHRERQEAKKEITT